MSQVEGPFVAQDLSGEPVLLGVPVENYWLQRRLAAYRWAAERLDGLEVLDAGSDDGYGTAILAEQAADVVGIDIGGRATRAPSFRAAPQLPYPDASFDAVVAIQVIEHVAGPRDFGGECARVLRPGGMLILSTPNRLTFSRNPFHSYAFAPDELLQVLEAHLHVELRAGIHHTARIRLLERIARKPFAERLVEQPAPEWPRWLRRAVLKTTAADFAVRVEDLDASLDVLAVARKPV